MAHRGPFQEYTEVCLACGQNSYATDECVPRNCWTGLFSSTEDLPAAISIPDLKKKAKRAIGPQWGYEIVGDEMVDESDLDTEAEIMAALTAPVEDEPLIGDYVYQPPYLEMRLRMLLTGTASPSNEAWAKALSKLLNHLEQEYDR